MTGVQTCALPICFPVTIQMVGINQVSQTIVSLDQISKDNQKETNLINDISNVVSSMAIEVLEEAVEDGYNLSNKTTKSMDDINEKVIAINEAITIIDQVAFQTNILSLRGVGFVCLERIRNGAIRAMLRKRLRIVQQATNCW